MKPFWFKLVWLCVPPRGFLLLLPLASASAFDTFDAYGTPDWASPDPGSYWQGSSAAPEYGSSEHAWPGTTSPEDTAPAYTSPRFTSPDYTPYAGQDASKLESHRYDSDQVSDWYSSESYGEQAGESWRKDERLPTQDAMPTPGWHPYDSATSRDGLDARAGYGPFIPSARDSDPYRRPPSRTPEAGGAYGSGAAQGWSGRRSSGQPSDWRARSQTPSYRFRDDPRLDSGDVVSGNADYRFRPLTAKELERQRETATASGFRPPRNERRQPGTRAPGGEAYGYEPDEVPGGFYQRYYRADN